MLESSNRDSFKNDKYSWWDATILNGAAVEVEGGGLNQLAISDWKVQTHTYTWLPTLAEGFWGSR